MMLLVTNGTLEDVVKAKINGQYKTAGTAAPAAIAAHRHRN